MPPWIEPKPECEVNGRGSFPPPSGQEPARDHAPLPLAYLLYNLALYSPLPLAYLLWRSLTTGRSRHGWGERLGYLPSVVREFCRTHRLLWVHAVSVGEVIAALPLLRELRRLNPAHHLLLSTTTETGRAIAAHQAREAAAVIYFPFDFPGILRRVLGALRPELFVAIDTELWPNLFRVAHNRGIATALANGRISDRAYRRIHRFRMSPLYRAVFPYIDRLCLQSPQDAARVQELGATPGQTWITGNSKFDEDHPEVSPAEQGRLRALLGLPDDAPVLLAGSTGDAEELPVLAAFQSLRAAHPTLRLVLVPRHIQRTTEIEGYVRAQGLASVRRTQLPAQSDRSRSEQCVIIVDTLGELARLYAVATVAFVGRSLVPQGGSNVLQAAAQGKPVLFGPDVSNVRDSAHLLLEQGVAWQVSDQATLGTQIHTLLAHPARLPEIDRTARALIAANRGSSRRTAEVLTELLPHRRP